MFGIKDAKVTPTELLVDLLCISTTWTAKKKSKKNNRRYSKEDATFGLEAIIFLSEINEY